MATLQEQLLKAGLIDAKKAKSVEKEKRKQTKVARKSKEGIIDEARISAEKALAEKAQRARESNRQLQEQAQQKAIIAQIKQLIASNKIPNTKGDIGYNFVDDKKIKKLLITAAIQHQLILGNIAIVKFIENKETQYTLVPTKVAEKIAQRDKSYVVLINDKTAETANEDDPYAAYKIPDDLMW